MSDERQDRRELVDAMAAIRERAHVDPQRPPKGDWVTLPTAPWRVVEAHVKALLAGQPSEGREPDGWIQASDLPETWREGKTTLVHMAGSPHFEGQEMIPVYFGAAPTPEPDGVVMGCGCVVRGGVVVQLCTGSVRVGDAWGEPGPGPDEALPDVEDVTGILKEAPTPEPTHPPPFCPHCGNGVLQEHTAGCPNREPDTEPDTPAARQQASYERVLRERAEDIPPRNETFPRGIGDSPAETRPDPDGAP
jgi:hypothetical protein